MAQLDAALSRFWSELAGREEEVLVLTASEFGRRPREHGTGTDHGTAAAHLLLGPAVSGGRYGAPPSLDRLDRAGNPAHEVDYRSVYATVLDEWLETDADGILLGDYERLGVVAAGAGSTGEAA